ncbi:hypothetical protein [Staphylococcus shinii]|uniref:hypothetical protein n=1 Tax=Staphylococcus shinii TaxID=2912228 RepID=UPI003CED360F
MKKILFLLLASLLVLVACGKTIEPSKVIKGFKDDGLNVKNEKEMKKEDYGSAPMKAEKAKIFEVEDGKNARLFMFKSDDDLKETKKYYDKLGKSSAILYSHTYSKNNYLLQMNGEIDDSTFKKYKKSLSKTLE